MKKVILVLGVASLLFTACGSSTNETSTEKKEVTSMMQKEEVNDGILVLNGGDDMKFDKTELRAKSGETVKLQLNHTGKMSKEAMGHNFVLLAEGTDFAAFASEAIKAKDTDYIPESMKGSIIAHTSTIGGGESTEIEFTAPAPGSYDFLCSFPGHSAMMKGKFIVE